MSSYDLWHISEHTLLALYHYILTTKLGFLALYLTGFWTKRLFTGKRNSRLNQDSKKSFATVQVIVLCRGKSVLGIVTNVNSAS